METNTTINYIPGTIEVKQRGRLITWEDVNGSQELENPRVVGLWDDDVEFHLVEDFHYSKDVVRQFLEELKQEYPLLGDMWEAIRTIELVAEGSLNEESIWKFFPEAYGNTDFVNEIKQAYVKNGNDASLTFDSFTYC